jgi:hypothetical protein
MTHIDYTHCSKTHYIYIKFEVSFISRSQRSMALINFKCLLTQIKRSDRTSSNCSTLKSKTQVLCRVKEKRKQKRYQELSQNSDAQRELGRVGRTCHTAPLTCEAPQTAIPRASSRGGLLIFPVESRRLTAVDSNTQRRSQ